MDLALRSICPAAFYKPNRAASEKYIVDHGGLPGSRSKGDRPFFESMAQMRGTLGGNRAGKTTKLVLEAGSNMIGCRPWYPPDNPWHTRGLAESDGDKPVRVRYVVQDLGMHIPEVMAEVEKWWPHTMWTITGKNERGGPSELTWYTGNRWTFLSHNMKPTVFEQIESDLNVWDEPPPKKVWTRLNRGLVSTGGRVIVGATLLDASGWFWDEVVTPNEANQNPRVFISWHSIWDNTAENGGYYKQTVENVISWLESIKDPDERLAREHGAPMHIGGLVIPHFGDNDLVDPFELPKDCVIIAAIDPGGTKPMAGLHAAIIRLPDGTLEGHFFDETYIRQSYRDLDLFTEVWRQKEAGETELKHPVPSYMTVIDPLAEEVQKSDRLGRSLRRILFEDHGIDTVLANRAGKRARLLQLNSRFKGKRWRIWRTCTRFRAELRQWSWDPESPKLTKGPDDVCDCASYIDVTEPFRLLEDQDDEIAPGVWVPEEYLARDEQRKLQRGQWKQKDRNRKPDFDGRRGIDRGYPNEEERERFY